MSLPRISFSWKPTISGREPWRWGLWIRQESKKKGHRPKLRIMVRGLLLWLGGFAVLAYLAVATAWYAMLEHRANNLVTWSDCVLAPVRWPEIRRKQGDANIAAGLAAMQARNWSEAVVRLQAGLDRSPNNRQGREKLGLFWVAAGQRERGLNLLQEGITLGYPGRTPMETILRVSLAGEDYDRALAVIDLALQQHGTAVERDRDWLRDQKCRILMLAKRYEAAIGWINAQPVRTDLLFESLVVAQTELHRYDEAKATLATWEKGSGALGGSQRLRVRLARETGDLETMRAALRGMRDRQPTDPSPWVYGVVQEALAGQTAAANEMLDQFLLRFGAKAEALLLVARPLVEIKRWDLYQRVDQQYNEMGLKHPGLQRLRVQALGAQHHYAQALQALQAMVPTGEAGATSDQGPALWFDLNRALLEALNTGESAPGARVLDLISKQPLALGAVKEIGEQLRGGGQEALAKAVFEIAHARFPGSADVNTQLAELRAIASAQPERKVEVPLVQDGQDLDIDAAVAASAGEAPVLERELGSAKLFLALCDRLIAERNWNDLGTALRELRRQRPTWLGANEIEVVPREIELNIAEKNYPALLTNVRFRLDGSLPRALEAMNLVRRLDKAGERGAAERVLGEIERRHPEFPPARRLRSDWAEADAASRAATANDTTLKP